MAAQSPAHDRRAASRQGSNSTALRRFNERRLIAALRRLGEASKAELARELGLTQNTVGQIVQGLEQVGLVRSVGRRLGERGQPATLLRLDPLGACAIGMRIDGDRLDLLAIDLAGRTLRQTHQALPPGGEAERARCVLGSLRELRRGLRPEPRRHLVGIGIALGPSGRAPHPNAAADPAIRAASALNLPVRVESQARAACLTELYQRPGKRLETYVFVYLGRELGVGLVLEGDLQPQAPGSAISLGLLPWAGRTAAAKVSPPGRLADHASADALRRHLGAGEETFGVAALEEAAGRQPAGAAAWLESCAHALVAPLLTLAWGLGVPSIVLDAAFPGWMILELVERLRGLLQAAAESASAAPPELLQGRAGAEAGLLGAALLALHRHLIGGGSDLAASRGSAARFAAGATPWSAPGPST